ncbi:hypothetical protein A0J61_10462, partial [Choanephora cucurbitarum]
MKDSDTIIELLDKEERMMTDQMIYNDNMVQPAIHNWNSNCYFSLYASTSDQRYVAYLSTSHMDKETLTYMEKANISIIDCH